MRRKSLRSAFTLVEVLIVVVIMAILAATIIPQFSDSARDAKVSTGTFNLHTIRSQIELYKSQHNGDLPGDTLAELTSRTNADGDIGTDAAQYPYGPYIRELPSNPFSNVNTVKAITNDPAQTGDVTADNAGGWLYNSTTGAVFMDHDQLYTE